MHLRFMGYADFADKIAIGSSLAKTNVREERVWGKKIN